MIDSLKHPTARSRSVRIGCLDLRLTDRQATHKLMGYGLLDQIIQYKSSPEVSLRQMDWFQGSDRPFWISARRLKRITSAVEKEVSAQLEKNANYRMKRGRQTLRLLNESCDALQNELARGAKGSRNSMNDIREYARRAGVLLGNVKLFLQECAEMPLSGEPAAFRDEVQARLPALEARSLELRRQAKERMRAVGVEPAYGT